MAVLSAVSAFAFTEVTPEGFTNADLRARVGALCTLRPRPEGYMTYDLRRLRLKHLIQRVPKSHRDVSPQLAIALRCF